MGDSFDAIHDLEDESFPVLSTIRPCSVWRGTLLGEYYRHLYRVMQPKGRLFHYIGDLGSRSGRNVVKGVARRLQEAGFSRVVRKPGAFGVVA